MKITVAGASRPLPAADPQSPLGLLLSHLPASEQAHGSPRAVPGHVGAAGQVLLRLPEATALAVAGGCLDEIAERDRERLVAPGSAGLRVPGCVPTQVWKGVPQD